MKKLCIFDLDGTLLNSLEDIAQAGNYALEQCGFQPYPTEDYKKFIGSGIRVLFERALPPGCKTAANIERMQSFFVPYYNRHKSDFTRPYPDIPELLKELETRSVLIAVASNKYQDATVPLIHHYFPGIHFAKIQGTSETVPCKPNPQIVFNILEDLDISVADALYIGDSEIDILTAQNSGMEVAAVSWGNRSRSELETYHPTKIVDSADELKAYILRLA